MRKLVFGHMRTAKAQIRLHSLFAQESLDTMECNNEEERPGGYFTHALADLNQRILYIFGRTLLSLCLSK